MMGQYFRAHGKFFASHPWEVILAVFTITICIIFKSLESVQPVNIETGDRVESGESTSPGGDQCHGWNWRVGSCDGSGGGGNDGGRDYQSEYKALDTILMTVVRCTAILYCYYQFRNLHKLGSNHTLGIVMLSTILSSLIFTSTVFAYLGSDVADLKDALFFFLLLIDLSKAGTLAQLALSSCNQLEVTENIARGMEVLGPSISLDTLVTALVICVGKLSGVHRLDRLCDFAVASVVVNCALFLTFYPACLSLIVDLSRTGVDVARTVKAKGKDSSLMRSLYDEDQKPNPVVQRVKIIMSTGLMVVHAHSRFSFPEKDNVQDVSLPNASHGAPQNRTEANDFTGYIMEWITMSADQITIMVMLVALLWNYILFKNDPEDLVDRLKHSAQTQQESTQTTEDEQKVSEETQTEEATIPMIQLNELPIANGHYRRPMFTIDEQFSQDQASQTEESSDWERLSDNDLVILGGAEDREPRPVDECLEILNSTDRATSLTDEEVISIVKLGGGHCPLYNIESVLNDPERGVRIRRLMIPEQARIRTEIFKNLPYKNYDYSKVMNACCENVLGYVQIPVGYAGPLLLDGVKYYVPMATTEGALVASTNRGCKAISVRGVNSVVRDIGMTRAPCVRFPSVVLADRARRWIEKEENYQQIKVAFDSTSRFARLQEIQIAIEGPTLYIRFRSLTGDAMGMNMVSKGAENALRYINANFPEMQIISLSGNFCSDKKPAAVNWINGRGKHVVCECIVPADKLRSILKTDAGTLVRCNKHKNLTGSAMAGSIGGNNAHAANMVTAIFIATGQDPAQNVTSSNCFTNMETHGESGEDLYITCTMPSLEVGTIGGGTVLPPQGACLEILGVKGAHKTSPGENSKQLARIICAAVIAGELSLMASLVNNDLVNSHLKHNRSYIAINTGTVNQEGNKSSSPSSSLEAKPDHFLSVETAANSSSSRSSSNSTETLAQ